MLSDVLRARIISQGPLTVAQFMEAALYDERLGYYARAARRSGVAGDFYTSVDAGPLFGELLAEFSARAHGALCAAEPDLERAWDLVEAGAGNGRLARDVLDALAARHAAAYAGVRLHLAERSGAARAEQAATLGPHAGRLASSGPHAPPGIRGVVYANELLDAMPVHRVRMTDAGLAECYVDVQGPAFILREGPLSTPRLAEYFATAGQRLPPGHVADVGLEAVAWTRRTSEALSRGYLLLIDYGHEADRLFDAAHADGTLRCYARHLVDAPAGGADAAATESIPPWLLSPGHRDITAQVDFSAVTAAARAAGLERLGVTDQGHFLLALGLADRLTQWSGSSLADVRRRLAARTLVVPGGLASTHHALLFCREAPAIIQFPGAAAASAPRPVAQHPQDVTAVARPAGPRGGET